MPDTKRCARCKETKPRSEFPPSAQRPDGLFNYCRPCKRLACNESRLRHSERRSAEAKARYAANPEPAKARRKKRYYADPAQAVAEAVAWNRAHPDKRRETNRKWVAANLHGLVRENVRRRYATRKGAPTIYFTPAQLAQRSAYYGDTCWVCKVAPRKEWDHVIPLSKGGWHCLSNLRPICRSCNASKRNRWPFVRPS